jgi:hypothetical protein
MITAPILSMLVIPVAYLLMRRRDVQRREAAMSFEAQPGGAA